MSGIDPLALQQDAPLPYRALATASAPSRLLLLLHGVGGNEKNLVALGQAFADDALVVFPRAPLTLAAGQYAWFPVRFEADGPRIDLAQALRSTQALQALIAHLQARHAIAAARTVVAGFSQGGIMSANVALVAPDAVAGFGVLSGRILPEIEPLAGPATALQALDALVVHGTQDSKLPVAWAERAGTLLARLGVPHRLALHAAGHELSAGMQRDFLDWYRREAARWNTPG